MGEKELNDSLSRLNTVGEETTEYDRTKSLGFWGVVVTVVGLVVAVGPEVLQLLIGKMGATSQVVQWFGIILSIAGILQKVLADTSYNRGRVKVKQLIAGVVESNVNLKAEQVRHETAMINAGVQPMIPTVKPGEVTGTSVNNNQG